jgi:hypothetical protein
MSKRRTEVRLQEGARLLKPGYPTIDPTWSPTEIFAARGSETASRSVGPTTTWSDVRLPPQARKSASTWEREVYLDDAPLVLVRVGLCREAAKASGDSLGVPDLRDPLVAEEMFACVTLYLARQDPMEPDPRAQLPEQVSRLFPSAVHAPHLRLQKTIETSARLSLGGC